MVRLTAIFDVSLFLHKAKKIAYKVKCYFFPFNVVKMGRVSREYTDPDYRLFHACFQILTDFVEKEKPFGESLEIQDMQKYIDRLLDFSDMFIDQDLDADFMEQQKAQYIKQNKIQSEILYLYNWYNNEYNEELCAYDLVNDDTAKMVYSGNDVLSKLMVKHAYNPNGVLTPGEANEIEDEKELINQVMLRRLIDVRHALWT